MVDTDSALEGFNFICNVIVEDLPGIAACFVSFFNHFDGVVDVVNPVILVLVGFFQLVFEEFTHFIKLSFKVLLEIILSVIRPSLFSFFLEGGNVNGIDSCESCGGDHGSHEFLLIVYNYNILISFNCF